MRSIRVTKPSIVYLLNRLKLDVSSSIQPSAALIQIIKHLFVGKLQQLGSVLPDLERIVKSASRKVADEKPESESEKILSETPAEKAKPTPLWEIVSAGEQLLGQNDRAYQMFGQVLLEPIVPAIDSNPSMGTSMASAVGSAPGKWLSKTPTRLSVVFESPHEPEEQPENLADAGLCSEIQLSPVVLELMQAAIRRRG